MVPYRHTTETLSQVSLQFMNQIQYQSHSQIQRSKHRPRRVFRRYTDPMVIFALDAARGRDGLRPTVEQYRSLLASETYAGRIL